MRARTAGRIEHNPVMVEDPLELRRGFSATDMRLIIWGIDKQPSWLVTAAIAGSF
jgi:hypothetical protein